LLDGGKAKGANRLAEFIKSGIAIDEALRIVEEEAAKDLVAS